MIVPIALPVGAVCLIDQVLPIAPGEEKRAHNARLFEHRQLGFYLLHGKICDKITEKRGIQAGIAITPHLFFIRQNR